MNGGTVSDVKRQLPFVSILAILGMIVVGVWFFRGGSFRLYASLFFGLYYLTQSSWLSIILVSVVQNILFLPLRLMYNRFHDDIKDFEDELKNSKTDDQYIMLNKKVREGSGAIIFYIVNFIFLLIAFISAGRVFLLEFYRTPIDPKYLYSFIHFPDYPLKGVIFHFPLIHVTQTMAVDWKWILGIWGLLFGGLAVLKLFWRALRPFFGKNQEILGMRIGYNKFLTLVGGVMGTVMIVTTIFLRNVPVGAEIAWWSADLSVQNTAFNIVTAVCTFLASIYAGYHHGKSEAIDAKKRGIPDEIIARVTKANLRQSFQNGIMLGIFALWVTRLMPCSHDLSVLAFEACYVLSPVTFDLLIPKKKDPTPPLD